MKLNRAVSGNTISRLPKYIRLLDEMERLEIERVSSGDIGRLLGLTPSQIRQDLSCFGSYGAQGYGYPIRELKENLKTIMGLDHINNIVVVGAGSIGKALLCHMQFQKYNYQVIAAFDTNEALIGIELNGTKVFHPDYLKYINEKIPIDICILTVPADQAKRTARMVADLGIPAIWNLTNVELGLKQRDVVIEELHFLDSLFSLTYYLKDARASKEKHLQDIQCK